MAKKLQIGALNFDPFKSTKKNPTENGYLEEKAENWLKNNMHIVRISVYLIMTILIFFLAHIKLN